MSINNDISEVGAVPKIVTTVLQFQYIPNNLTLM